MNFNKKKNASEEYPIKYYIEFLKYIKHKYNGDYYHVLPKDIAQYWISNIVKE
jgi:thymidylate synthase ThyX